MNPTRRPFLVIASAALFLVTACTRPAGSSASAIAGQSVSGRATAGPTCPVERNPPDPACAARPVAGAILIIQDAASGREVARVTTDRDGRFLTALAPGAYRLVPQPVSGLMGGGRPLDFQVSAGRAPAPLEVSYDTGIR